MEEVCYSNMHSVLHFSSVVSAKIHIVTFIKINFNALSTDKLIFVLQFY